MRFISFCQTDHLVIVKRNTDTSANNRTDDHKNKSQDNNYHNCGAHGFGEDGNGTLAEAVGESRILAVVVGAEECRSHCEPHRFRT